MSPSDEKNEKKLINLMRGWPAPSVLPADLLHGASSRLLTNPEISVPALQYGPDEGYAPLRKGLADWLGRHYQVQSDPERICITGGASQNMANVLQSFTDPVYTRAVWVIAPCYYLACGVFEDAGFEGRLRASPEDEEGVDVKALEERIQRFEEEEQRKPDLKPYKQHREFRKLYRHIIYTVPTCSNPSNRTTTLPRREALVRLARKYDCLIISDDVYDFLQWPYSSPVTPERPESMRLPRLCDIDRAMGPSENDPQGFGCAISNGSFSKIVGPGVRTGWVEGSPAFAFGLGKTASSRSGGAPSQLCAAILSDIVASGELERHINETTRVALQRRYRLMMETIKERIAPTGAAFHETTLKGTDVCGGYFIWLTVPDGIDASIFAEAAMEEENVIINAGPKFEVAGDEGGARFDKQFRLCFAWEDEEDLVEGVRRLGDLLSRMRQDKGAYEKSAREARAKGKWDTFK